jgi:hypothetical protein
MAFIERVMHWGQDEQDTEPPAFEPPDRWLASHDVYSGMVEVIEGEITVAAYKSQINATAEDEVDIDAIVANAPGPEAARAIYVQRIHAVFMLTENRWPTYNTPSGVRTRLGI